MSLKLYTYPGNKNAYKALIAAEYVEATIDVPAFQMGVDNKSPSFLLKNPFGKVPVLETPKGCIFESNAIARYVARLSDVGLFGNDNEDMKEEAAIAAIEKSLTGLNEYLLDRTVLVGESITLADIVSTCNLYLGMTKVFDPKFRESFPHVERYFMTMVNQPAFKKVMGDVELCKERMKKTAAKKGKDAVSKPQTAEKPSEEEKPKKDSKPKAWYDLLPPSPMELDAWKRLYSNAPNSDFRNIAIKRLWEGGPVPASQTDEVFPGYDSEGYSMWFCEYKYPEENTVNFMVMNKVGGLIQRLDYARKYSFGVMCILKDANGLFPVKGVWIFRGQDIPQQIVDESYDLELYTMTKVDLSDPAQKKLVEDMIVEEDTIDGLELVEAKIFK